MTLLLALAVTLSRNTDPFVRYANFVKAHPSVQVHIASTINGKTPAVGTLRFQRPDRVVFHTKGDSFDYSVSNTPRTYVEIENRNRVFDEFESPERIEVYNSDISPTANMLLPRAPLVMDLKYIFRSKPTTTASGTSDVIYEKDQGSAGVSETWATIDSEGKISTMRRKFFTRAGDTDIVWQLTDYKYIATPKLDPFLTPVPAGYVQYSVPRFNKPLEIGRLAPVAGWVDGRTGKTVNLLDASGKKPFLVVYSAPGSGPGKASSVSVERLKKQLPVYVIGDAVKDPDGKRIHVLDPPGSPMFYLIDATGKVKKLWFGYDPAQATAFESDVVSSSKSSD